MNVTLRQLRAFTGVYRTRSITRAARELGITQSAASLLIQQLEVQLGVRLFDRSTRSVQPTPAADEAYQSAERMLSDALGLSRRMRDLAQARAGRVAFLASAGAASRSSAIPPTRPMSGTAARRSRRCAGRWR